jgi:hypothetical protein
LLWLSGVLETFVDTSTYPPPLSQMTDQSRPAIEDLIKSFQPCTCTGGTRWFEDYQATVTWHNAGRTDAYTLSPWDQTLVLDADYVVASDQLKILLDSNQEFLAHDRLMILPVKDNFVGLNEYGEYKIPMWWATVMMFRRYSCRVDI